MAIVNYKVGDMFKDKASGRYRYITDVAGQSFWTYYEITGESSGRNFPKALLEYCCDFQTSICREAFDDI